MDDCQAGQIGVRPSVRRTQRGRGRAGRGGFTLIEVMVGMIILAVGAVSFSGALVSSIRASKSTDEVNRATKAAHAVLERIQAEAFADAFRRFNSNTADDPGGAGTAPGANFAVTGLTAEEGDADGFPLEVVFPIQPGDSSRLQEDVVLPELGMPRDLNGDGVIDSANHSVDYKLLPVLVRVRWRSAAGSGRLEFKTMLANY
jgi:prepilin-type N-terminal cleavage/methylation domain-containing protein